MFYFDYTYLLLVMPALLLGLWAQMRMTSTFQKYGRISAGSGLTGADTARMILSQNHIRSVYVEHVSGELNDHFDPSAKVIRLSDPVYGRSSIAAIGVAAHEAGHAVQHANGYLPIKIRNLFVPVANLGSRLSIPLLILGLIFGYMPLVHFGILLFSVVAIFQLITLPVEFNASRRAVEILEGEGVLSEEELSGAKKVLSAAALTYVAALLLSIAQLLRLVTLYGNRRRD